jgi:hypothetical protein
MSRVRSQIAQKVVGTDSFPGLVPTDARRLDGIGIVDIGNGDVAPQWGVELYVYGGTINYGPWADRER